MSTFEDLVLSRKAWIAEVLQPWCRNASLTSLRLAEQEWGDIAGRVAPEKSLWVWAWSRFPDLVHESLGIEETTEVKVVLKDGRHLRGFPDSRASLNGSLVLWGTEMDGCEYRELGPFSIEAIAEVRRMPS